MEQIAKVVFKHPSYQVFIGHYFINQFAGKAAAHVVADEINAALSPLQERLREAETAKEREHELFLTAHMKAAEIMGNLRAEVSRLARELDESEKELKSEFALSSRLAKANRELEGDIRKYKNEWESACERERAAYPERQQNQHELLRLSNQAKEYGNALYNLAMLHDTDICRCPKEDLVDGQCVAGRRAKEVLARFQTPSSPVDEKENV